MMIALSLCQWLDQRRVLMKAVFLIPAPRRRCQVQMQQRNFESSEYFYHQTTGQYSDMNAPYTSSLVLQKQSHDRHTLGIKKHVRSAPHSRVGPWECFGWASGAEKTRTYGAAYSRAWPSRTTHMSSSTNMPPQLCHFDETGRFAICCSWN